MASVTIRNLEESLKARLRLQAARHNRSMEEEARDILRIALAAPASRPVNLAEAIRARIEPFGGVDISLAPREPLRPAPDFE